MTFSQLYDLKPKGYNTPWHAAMCMSQWWHQGFLWGWWSYQQYEAQQNMAYIRQEQLNSINARYSHNAAQAAKEKEIIMATQQTYFTVNVSNLFAAAWQKHCNKHYDVFIPPYEAETMFTQIAELLLETDVTMPRGKVPAIKLLRNSVVKSRVFSVQCCNIAFADCFEAANKGEFAGMLQFREQDKPQISLKDAKDIIDCFLSVLERTQAIS